MLLVGFVAAVFVYSVYFLARGTLAGNGRFGAYGTLLGVEGLTRVAAAACLAALGAHAVGAYGLAISLPCLIGMAVALRGQRGLATAGPEAKWAELSTALGYLLAGWLLAQLLAYSGVLAVKLLAPASDSGAGGRFLNGLIIARIPLFFFQAVLASLLPRLAAQATAGHLREFRHGFERLLVMVGGVAAVAVVGYFALGPFVLRVLFGKSYELGHVDMALLAAATGIYMVALALAQALIALAGHAQVAFGWLVGMVAFLAVVAPTSGLFLRVEVGLAVASVASACVMGMFLLRRLAAVLGPSRDENTAFVAEPPVA